MHYDITPALSQFEELTGREVQVSMKDLFSQRDLLGESVDLEIPPELGEKLIWESGLALQALKSMTGRPGHAGRYTVTPSALRSTRTDRSSLKHAQQFNKVSAGSSE